MAAEGHGVDGVRVRVVDRRHPRTALDARMTQLLTTVSLKDGSLFDMLPDIDNAIFVADHPRYLPVVSKLESVGSSVLLNSGRAVRVALQVSRDRSHQKAVLDHIQTLGVLRGACVSWDDESVSGFPVHFQRCVPWSFDSKSEGEELLAVATIRGLPKVQLQLRAVLEGYLPFRSVLGAAELEHRLYPVSSKKVHGRVLNLTGDPIPGAVVTSGSGALGLALPGGRFDLATKAFPVGVTVAAVGFASQTVAFEVEGQQSPIELTPAQGASFSIDSETIDIEELVIKLERGFGGVDSRVRWRTASFTARYRGASVEIFTPNPGTYRLLIKGDGVLGYRYPAFDLGLGQMLDLGVLPLEEGAAVSGIVVDATEGVPIAGVQARLLADEGSLFQSLAVTAPSRVAVSNEKGEFRVAGVTEGEYSLVLEKSGLAATSRTIRIEQLDNQDLGEVLMGTGTSVVFAVSRSDETPYPGAYISVFPASTGSLVPVGETETNTEGEAPSILLGSGYYRVVVSSERDLLEQAFEVPVGESELNIPLKIETVAVEGSVRIGGLEVDNGYVGLVSNADPGRSSGKLIIQAEPSQRLRPFVIGAPRTAVETAVRDNGTFALLDVQPGIATATYTSADGSIYERRAMITAGEANYLELEFDLENLEGRTVDKDTGDGISTDLRVTSNSGALIWYGASAENGEFVVRELDAGSQVNFTASANGYRTVRYSLDLRSATGQREVLIELEPGSSGTIDLTLLRENGSPMVRSRVALVTSTGEVLRALATNLDGHIGYRDLPLDRYTLVWTDSVAGTGAIAVELKSDDAEAHLERRVPNGVNVELSCLDQTCASRPLPSLQLVSESGIDLVPFLQGSIVGKNFSLDGRAVLGRVSPGLYRLWASGVPALRQTIAPSNGQDSLQISY